jgi:hypothetical protein
MRPYQHAQTSAARSGRAWGEDLAIHEFIDSTKAAFPDLRHRMILHSVDLGAQLAALAFPTRSDVREIVRQHVIEDIGHARTLGDWLTHCSVERLPRPHPGSWPIEEEALIEAERRRQGLANSEGPRAVLEMLRLPSRLAPEYGDAAWSVLCNSFGPCLVRQIAGPPRELRADGSPAIFDPAWCAEAMIFGIYRTIPELRSVVTALRTSHQRRQGDVRPNA